MAEKNLVEGYGFDNAKQAGEVKRELEAVLYLTDKIRQSSPETACKIYQKMVEQEMFHTSVGCEFVNALGDYLVQNHFIEEPLTKAAEEQQESGEQKADELHKSLERKLLRTKRRLNTSVILNILLAAGIAVMLYIASTSSSINILNYETALVDKYASWAEELKDKERDLKEREAALKERESQTGSFPETKNK